MEDEMKTILMIGTAHEFQGASETNPWRREFREMLSSVLERYRIQIILEEWSARRGEAIGKTLETKEIKWHNVSTPPGVAEFDTYAAPINFEPDPDWPSYLSFRQYPFEVQEKREQFMLERIVEYMSERERGLLVVGMNHLHSLTSKLLAHQFEVTCGNWSQICDKGTKVMQKCRPPDE
jgi:hypothetical protein